LNFPSSRWHPAIPYHRAFPDRQTDNRGKTARSSFVRARGPHLRTPTLARGKLRDKPEILM